MAPCSLVARYHHFEGTRCVICVTLDGGYSSLQPPGRLHDVTSQNYAVVIFDVLLINEAAWRKEFSNFSDASASLPSLILIVQTSVCSSQLLGPSSCVACSSAVCRTSTLITGRLSVRSSSCSAGDRIYIQCNGVVGHLSRPALGPNQPHIQLVPGLSRW
jgi:hypothetical protein